MNIIVVLIFVVLIVLLMAIALLRDRPVRQRSDADQFMPSTPQTPTVGRSMTSAGRDVHAGPRTPDRLDLLRPTTPATARYLPSANRKLS
jgi:hypothetical protein